MPKRIDKRTGEIINNTTVQVRTADGKLSEPVPFNLESPRPGHISDHVIAELCRCYREAADYAAALGEALKAQAEKSAIEPKALRMYIAALCSDNRAKAKKVADDLALLLGEAGD